MKQVKKIWIFCMSHALCFQLGAQMIGIKKIDAAVTANEIASFKELLSDIKPAPSNLGNNWVYGTSGMAMEAMGLVYEVSKDISLLDKMIYFADAALMARNHPDSGRIIWTGKKELCWPNKALTAADAAYSGSENGDVLAHVAYCAKLIILQKELWNKNPSIGDPYKFGTTYFERAKTYVKESDKVIQTYLLPHFVKDYKFLWPDNAQWNTLGPRYDKDGGKGIPWNQQAMLAGGFQRVAECHELLNQEQKKIALYDSIVKTYVDDFVSQLVSYKVNGYECYKWSYAVNDVSLKYMEDQGHAGYDVWGICRSFERKKYGIDPSVIQNLSNTVQYVIYKGDGQFAKRVDGTNGVQNSIGASFLQLAKYNRELYQILASVNLELIKNKWNYLAHLLWVKNQINKKA